MAIMTTFVNVRPVCGGLDTRMPCQNVFFLSFSFLLHLPDDKIVSMLCVIQIGGAAHDQAYFHGRTCLSFLDLLMSLFHLKQSRALFSGCRTFRKIVSYRFLNFSYILCRCSISVCGSVTPQCGYGMLPVATAKP